MESCLSIPYCPKSLSGPLVGNHDHFLQYLVRGIYIGWACRVTSIICLLFLFLQFIFIMGNSANDSCDRRVVSKLLSSYNWSRADILLSERV